MYEQPFHTNNIANCHFLVTGGGGFIGSHLVEYLILHGAGKVRVLDNFSTGSIANLAPFLPLSNFELVEGDIRSPEACAKAVEGMHYLLHQAALGSVPRSISNPAVTNDVNVGGFVNMLVAAKDAGIRRMVYAASSSTYGSHAALPKKEDTIGKPLSPYAVSKLVNELYADVFSQVYQFHTVGLRYFNVFGPRQSANGAYAAVIPLFIKAAINGNSPVINGDGETSRDFTFVANAVQANIRALFTQPLRQHEVFNIACGQANSLNQLWQYIAAITGCKRMPVYRQERAGDVKHSLADVSKAARQLGYQPQISLQQGLRITVPWYMQAEPPKS